MLFRSRGERRARRLETFTTTDDLGRRLKKLGGSRVDAVFHAAAVSDFTFGKVWRRTPAGRLVAVRAGKISSRAEGLLAELIPTAKIISELRGWFSRACLVGWKYEVDGARAGVLAKARKQIAENDTDAGVANGPAFGKGFGLVTRAGEVHLLKKPELLFAALERLALARAGK